MIPGRTFGLAHLMRMTRRRLPVMAAAFVAAAGLSVAVGYVRSPAPARQTPAVMDHPAHGVTNDRANDHRASDARAAAEREVDIATEVARRFEEDLAKTTRQLDDQDRALAELESAPSTQKMPPSPATLVAIKAEQARVLALTESIARDRATLNAWQSVTPSVPEPSAAEKAKAANLHAAKSLLAELEDRLTPQHPDVLRQRRVISDLQAEDSGAPPVAAPALTASRSQEIARLAERVSLQESERRSAEAAIASLRAKAASTTGLATDDGQWAERLREFEALNALVVALQRRTAEARKAADAALQALPPPVVAAAGTPVDPPPLPFGGASVSMLPWALAGALVFALLVGAVREGTDTRIYDAGDVQAAAGAAPLATIGDIIPSAGPAATDREASSLPEASSPMLIWHPRCPDRTIEQYRRLGHAVRRLRAERQSRVIGVTSSLAGEGKTLTAINLAVTLANSYRQRVLIIDADLRRPNVAALMSLHAQDGLADWLRRDDDRDCPMVRLSSHLSVVPAGTPADDPVPLLTSLRMAMLIASARADFEWVMVDTPPAGLICDAGALEGSLDGFLVMAIAGQTPSASLRQALSTLGSGRVLGVVLNRLRGAQGADSAEGASDYTGPRAS